jgi:hypothetical protein
MTARNLLMVSLLLTACREPKPVDGAPETTIDTRTADVPAPEIENPAWERPGYDCITFSTDETVEDPVVLPSGLWFRSGYTHMTMNERDWKDATHAVVAGVDLDVQEAKALVRDLQNLPVGYPLVTHAHEIFLSDMQWSGIIVVAGLFSSKAQACKWYADSGLENAMVVPLLDYKAAFERRQQLYKDYKRPRVVQVAHGPPVKAYPTGAIEMAEHKFATTGLHDPLVEPPVEPLCSIEGGELFLIEAQRWFDVPFHRWAPVYCGDEPAYVPWISTTLESVIYRTAEGNARMFQVGGVECDVPCFCEWDLDENGIRLYEGKLRDACKCPPSCCGGPCS